MGTAFRHGFGEDTSLSACPALADFEWRAQPAAPPGATDGHIEIKLPGPAAMLKAPPPGDRFAASEAYRPVVRGFLVAAVAYYSLILAAHFVVRSGDELLMLAVPSGLAAGVALIGYRMLGTPRHPIVIETIGLSINALVVFNVWISLQINFDEAKMVYFVVMAMIFAFSGASLRQTLPSIAVALLVMLAEILDNKPSLLVLYLPISLAGAISAVAIAQSLRTALRISVHATTAAQERSTKADSLLLLARSQSLTDSLTRLPNRRAFFEHIEQGFLKPGTEARRLTLILVALDSFKAINDFHGHSIGDGLLVAVAKRFQAQLPANAFLARIAGDEFNVLLGEGAGEERARALSSRLLDCLREPFHVAGRTIHVSASIGHVTASAAEPIRSILEHADYALLHAKRERRGQAVGFNQRHAREMDDRFIISQELRTGRLAQELEIALQPQFNLESGQIIGAEVLARWTSSMLGEVSPGKFVAVAEAYGLMPVITRAVIAKTLDAMAGWRTPLPVSINLSAQDILSEQMIEQVIAAVAASPIPPGQIEFEVTETAMIADGAQARANLLALAARGHRLALDDFGTGYSNFSYLRRLPFSKLKIDRSFIADPNDSTSTAMARSMVKLSKLMTLDCIIEGIENADQLHVARAIGVPLVQGFYFGKPMPSDAFADRYTSQRAA